MPESVRKRLTDLLEKTAGEHHEYEKSALKGVRDEEWDMWYGSWLVEHGINDLLNSDLRSADLATLLRDINDQHGQSDQLQGWSEYTARQLIETASGAPRES